MVYGTDAGTMNLAYSGSKTTTPGIVGEARQLATSLINGFLNRSEDLSTIPTVVHDTCNWVAATYIKNRDISPADLLEMVKSVLETIRDDINQQDAFRWGNMEFV